MGARVAEFLINLQSAAQERGHAIEVNVVEIPARRWMLPTFDDAEAIARQLPRGLSVNNREGPDGRAFMSGTGLETLWSNSGARPPLCMTIGATTGDCSPNPTRDPPLPVVAMQVDARAYCG